MWFLQPVHKTTKATTKNHDNNLTTWRHFSIRVNFKWKGDKEPPLYFQKSLKKAFYMFSLIWEQSVKKIWKINFNGCSTLAETLKPLPKKSFKKFIGQQSICLLVTRDKS